MDGPAGRLRITEIFLSLQGEARAAGWPTVFVRLTGCPLRCAWCDSAYAFSGGTSMTTEAVLEEVERLASDGERSVRRVCVTGGEPLAQRACLPLLTRLCDAGYAVSLETGGSIDIGDVDPRVERVIDLKPPGSGEETKNRWQNLELLTPRDQIKIVIAGRGDYEWAVKTLQEHQLASRCEVLFSPVYGAVDPRELADWIVADKLPVRFQLQLHKLLWEEERGR